MATSTLPLAADQDPFQHITVINRTVEDLLVSPQPGEQINGIVDYTITIRPVATTTFQSNGTDGWWVISTGKPNVNVNPFDMTGGPHLVPQSPTWFTLPGTEFTPAFEGVFGYTGVIRFDVTGVPGNQAWDVDLQLYDATNAAVIGHLDFYGAGNPDAPIRENWALFATVEPDATYYLRVSRTSTTGDIYVDSCETELTGPM